AGFGGHTGVEHRHDRREATVEVDPVVTITNRLVKGCERGSFFVNLRCRGAEPGVDAVEHHCESSILVSSSESSRGRRGVGAAAAGRAQMAQRRAAVWTGASQSLTSSSSSLSRVTEKPAISRLVMYGPTRLRPILIPFPPRILLTLLKAP